MPEMQKQKGETTDYFFSDDYFQQKLTRIFHENISANLIYAIKLSS